MLQSIFPPNNDVMFEVSLSVHSQYRGYKIMGIKKNKLLRSVKPTSKKRRNQSANPKTHADSVEPPFSSLTNGTNSTEEQSSTTSKSSTLSAAPQSPEWLNAPRADESDVQLERLLSHFIHLTHESRLTLQNAADMNLMPPRKLAWFGVYVNMAHQPSQFVWYSAASHLYAMLLSVIDDINVDLLLADEGSEQSALRSLLTLARALAARVEVYTEEWKRTTEEAIEFHYTTYSRRFDASEAADYLRRLELREQRFLDADSTDDSLFVRSTQAKLTLSILRDNLIPKYILDKKPKLIKISRRASCSLSSQELSMLFDVLKACNWFDSDSAALIEDRFVDLFRTHSTSKWLNERGQLYFDYKKDIKQEITPRPGRLRIQVQTKEVLYLFHALQKCNFFRSDSATKVTETDFLNLFDPTDQDSSQARHTVKGRKVQGHKPNKNSPIRTVAENVSALASDLKNNNPKGSIFFSNLSRALLEKA